MVLVNALTMLTYNREGGGIFLNIRNNIMLLVVLYALCLKKMGFFSTTKNKFYHGTRGLKIFKTPLYPKKFKSSYVGV